jgi:dolichyl-phosphate beta-glucosyltransferase
MADTTPAPLVSLVVPAYNEERNLRRGVLAEVAEYVSKRDYEAEVIVVDDGSEDATAALVEEAAGRWPFLRLLRVEHGGKARAVAAGVETARGEYVFFTDTDQSTPITHLEDGVRELRGGADIVIGSRWLKGGSRLGEPLFRRAGGKAYSLLVRGLLLPGISDSQCGFKGFRREVARDLFQGLVVFGEPSGPVSGPRVTAFDVELLVQARERGYRIVEIPVTWRHVETTRVSALRDGLRMVREALAIWMNKRRGMYRRADARVDA